MQQQYAMQQMQLSSFLEGGQVVKEPPPPPPPQTEIVNDGRGVWGDPHYDVTGKDGERIKFDHHGTAGNTYNIFSGDNLTIDGKYAPYKKAPCIIQTTKITAGWDKITYDAKTNLLTLNGEKISEEEGQIKLRDGTVLDFSENNLKITSRENDAHVEIKDNGGSLEIDPEGKFSNLDGIIGTAVKNSEKLSEEEANKFDVTKTRAIA